VNRIAVAFLLLAAAALSACNGGGAKGVRFVASKSAKPQAEPIRNLAGAEIPPAITGKTFQYTRPDGNGFVTYNADGTFSFQDDAKGTGIGKWLVNGDQFCESFGAGAPTDCGEFKSTGDAYFAAKSRLVEMKS